MAGLSASLACHPEMIPASTNPNLYQNPKAADDAIVQTVASYAVVFGIVRCHRLGIPFTSPSLDSTFYENLFLMAGLVDSSTAHPDPVLLSVFRRFGSANVDHGMALCILCSGYGVVPDGSYILSDIRYQCCIWPFAFRGYSIRSTRFAGDRHTRQCTFIS